MDARGGGETRTSFVDARKLLDDASELEEEEPMRDELGYGTVPDGIADGYWIGPWYWGWDRPNADCGIC